MRENNKENKRRIEINGTGTKQGLRIAVRAFFQAKRQLPKPVRFIPVNLVRLQTSSTPRYFSTLINCKFIAVTGLKIKILKKIYRLENFRASVLT